MASQVPMIGHRGLGSQFPLPHQVPTAFQPLTSATRTQTATAVQTAADAVRGLPYVSLTPLEGPGVR